MMSGWATTEEIGSVKLISAWILTPKNIGNLIGKIWGLKIPPLS
jgi:hypothetical protein